MTDKLARLTHDLGQIAGESVAVQEIGGCFYAFGSELAVLRLFHKYNSPNCRAGYSQNLKTWYFSIEPKHQMEGVE